MNLAILSREPQSYSTNRLMEAARERGHQPQVIDHTECMVSMAKGKPNIYYQGESLSHIHAVVPRIGASVTFMGAAIVRQFEMMEVFTANESLAITRSRDKLRSLQLLSRTGVGIPHSAFTKHPKGRSVDRTLELVGGCPVVIKLLEGTQGLGVVLAETPGAARSVIEAFSGLQANILIQEFIEEAKGSDIRVFVLGGEAIAAMKRQGQPGEFRSNLHRGGTAEPYPLNRKMKAAAENAAKAMRLGIAGVDLLPAKRGPLVLEVNSSPGLEGIERATGINLAEKIMLYLEKNTQKKPRVGTTKG